jgi:hypothetical protein
MPLPPVGLPPPGDPGFAGEAWDERDEPTEAELFGLCPDLLAGPPDGEDAWLGDLSLAELDALADQYAAGEGRVPEREAIGAGFGRDLPGDAAAGFAAGGPLDGLAPGTVLAGFAGDAFEAGLGGLSDDELVGVLCAARRLESWQAAVEFTAVAELDKRRRAQAERPESSRVHDHVNAELAAALVVTGRSADALLDLSRGLARLPVVLAALAAGRIDRDRAAVFVAELAVLDAKAAAAVAMGFTDRAGQMTTGQLRAALRAMVLTLNPDAAKERAERGRRRARVEVWPESSGNSGLAGRELPAADVLAADQRITAIAQALRDAGAAGGMDELRAAVLCALLTGRDPESLLPGRAGRGLGAMTGTVHLTMPAAAWLGQSDAPGDVAGFGPLDAGSCRDLATRLAESLGTSWCLTVTGPDGRAVAHGCAKAGPVATRQPGQPPGTGPPQPPGAGPPGPSGRTPGWQAWLASVQVQWLERDRCGHPRRVRSYRPGRTLRHLVIIRHRTCGFPGCSRPAVRCDLDHTVPYKPGITCECNLSALCRQHHKTKQAQGWHLTQPQPGVLVWTTPHGRTYQTVGEPYPV